MPDFGWVKDKYNPAAVYHIPRLKYVPASDLSAYLPNVRNQLKMGSCVGHGIGGACGVFAKQNDMWTDWYSPQWIWNGARWIEGTLNENAGVRPEDAYQFILMHGLLLEKWWPYSGNELDMAAPSSERMNLVENYSDFQVVRIDNGLEGIMSALSDGHAVAFGAPWPGNWVNGSKDILPDPGNFVPAGGHETFIYGHDEAKGIFYDQNSWGTSWSDGGRCKVPFEWINYAKKWGGYDAHYLTWKGEPVPVTHKCFLLEWFKNLRFGYTGLQSI